MESGTKDETMSPKEPVWEEVFKNHIRGENATLVNRMSVPGGWMYVYTFMKFHSFTRDEIHISTVFVPDPEQRRNAK
jgi:hypothetical protein